MFGRATIRLGIGPHSSCHGVILLLQYSVSVKHCGSLSVRGFHQSLVMHATANHPQEKNQSLTLCTQVDGVRTITLNYAEKR